nr:MAG TPA: hypothetical protein [Caudoviricetes sp.]
MATTKLTTDVEQYLKWAGNDGTTQQQYQEFVRNIYGTLSDVVKITMWQPNTSYPAGAVLISPDMPTNILARVSVAGTTGAAIPEWGGAGTTVTDGTVTWSMLYRTIDYATQKEVTAGTNTTKIVTPAMLGKTIKTDLASENTGTLNAADKTVVGGVTGILPVTHGGTGADSLANITVGKASTLVGDAGLWDYLHRLGTNPTLPTTNAALCALGVFMSYLDQKNKIANQPSQYGQLLNIPADKVREACQLWVEQNSGRLYHRGGNGSIGINDTPFKRFLDTDDISAVGVVAGDVSNTDAWWVKLGGAVPLIIQGGKCVDTYTWSYPIALTRLPLLALITGLDLPAGGDSGAPHVNDVGTTSLLPYVGRYHYAAYIVVIGI